MFSKVNKNTHGRIESEAHHHGLINRDDTMRTP